MHDRRADARIEPLNLRFEGTVVICLNRSLRNSRKPSRQAHWRPCSPRQTPFVLLKELHSTKSFITGVPAPQEPCDDVRNKKSSEVFSGVSE
jgi:hypothetical protein